MQKEWLNHAEIQDALARKWSSADLPNIKRAKKSLKVRENLLTVPGEQFLRRSMRILNFDKSDHPLLQDVDLLSAKPDVANPMFSVKKGKQALLAWGERSGNRVKEAYTLALGMSLLGYLELARLAKNGQLRSEFESTDPYRGVLIQTGLKRLAQDNSSIEESLWLMQVIAASKLPNDYEYLSLFAAATAFTQTMVDIGMAGEKKKVSRQMKDNVLRHSLVVFDQGIGPYLAAMHQGS